MDTHRNEADASLNEKVSHSGEDVLNVVGLLPCPVRIPLLEGFTEFVKKYKTEHNREINYDLKAASMGLEWVEENIRGIQSVDDLPDLFISAGFDMFFDEELIGRFKKDGIFEDLTGFTQFNELFDGLDLRDPKGHYSMISVVPAVFLVNTEELNGRKCPESWEDILSPEFENAVSLPVGDFDLFNGILLNIHKKYGDENVKKIRRSLLESMHPSQMVKNDRKKMDRPAVTIMPYFFTKMVREGGTMRAIWPKDGAIISPIFMLAKASRKDDLQPVVDFLASRKVGEILSHQGLFPSVIPGIDNRIPAENKFMWLDWDYIYSNDISKQIQHCDEIFNSSLKKNGVQK
ncbi:ABC transporter substrate-binding protein [bacterium]|nr:ABC transporter substrate-binding protein [bacterium]